MREKRNFAQRTKVLENDEVKKKYYLVYEGKNTESIYFEAVDSLKLQIGINPMIELIPIVRSYSEEGWSNPQKIVERINQNIQEFESGVFSYETLLNCLMEYLEDQGYVVNNRTLSKTIWNQFQVICKEQWNMSLQDVVENPELVCQKLLNCLSVNMQLPQIVVDISKILKLNNFDYVEGLDKICFIVDRDKGSFKEEQYDSVLEQCKQNGYGIYVTNPCFEFWLLLHFEDVQQLDNEKLLNNPAVTCKRRYTENELKKRMPHFKKSRYDARELVKNIGVAVQNEKYYCEDIDEMKNLVGSNIGILITEISEKL